MPGVPGERKRDEPDDRIFAAPAKRGMAPWIITQSEGIAMQNSGWGKPFWTSARWDQAVSGTLIIDENGELRLDHIEWGDAARRRRTRRHVMHVTREGGSMVEALRPRSRHRVGAFQ